MVAAHNHVLRRWLRGESPGPGRQLDDAMRLVIGLFTATGDGADGGGAIIVAFRTGQDIDALIPVLRRLAEASPE